MNEELTTEAMDAAPAGSLIIDEPEPNIFHPVAVKMENDDETTHWVDVDGDLFDAGGFLVLWRALRHRLWLYTAPLFTKEG